MMCCMFHVLAESGLAAAFASHRDRLDVHRPDWAELDLGQGKGVSLTYIGMAIHIGVHPTVHSFADHRNAIQPGLLAAKLAASIAAECDGQVIQVGLVGACQPQYAERVQIASYPDEPLVFARLCPGFRAVMVESLA